MAQIKVLIVDDTSVFATTLEMLLLRSIKDLVVRVATDPDSARQEMEEFVPDICIVDVFFGRSAKEWNEVAREAVRSDLVVLRTSSDPEQARQVVSQDAIGDGLFDKDVIHTKAAEVIRREKELREAA